MDKKVKTDIKKQLKSGITKSESACFSLIGAEVMRYYPAFGVKSVLVAPFRRFLGA
jgi:hypothetical protein